jgi:hypothetical protein
MASLSEIIKRSLEILLRGKFITLRCTWCGRTRTVWRDNDWPSYGPAKHCCGLGFWRDVTKEEK